MCYKLRLVFSVIAVLSLASAALAQEPPKLELPRTTNAPVIDGDLGDACWKECPSLPFVLLNTNEAPALAANARIVSDGAWLFVSYDFEDKALKQEVGVKYQIDDTIPPEDCAELFIDPGTNGKVYYHLAADRFGQQYDKRLEFNEWSGSYNQDANYNGHWRAAGRTTERGWSVEMAIPVAEFLDDAPGATTWRVNFCRTDRNDDGITKTWSQWAQTGRRFHDPSRFGYLTNIPAEASDPFRPVIVAVRFGVITDFRRGFEYPILVTLRNDSTTPGTVHARITDVKAGGGIHEHEEDVELKPQEERTLSIHVRNNGPVDPNPEALLTMSDKLGDWKVLMNHRMSPPVLTQRTLDAYFDRNYYTLEEEARLYYTAARPEKQLETLSLEVVVIDPQGNEIAKLGCQPIKADEQLLSLPLKDLPIGANKAAVRVFAADKAMLDEKWLDLVKRAPRETGNEVKVDQYNRCLLVNDKPFFPYGPCLMSANLEPLFKVGFNTIFRWGGDYDYHALKEKGLTAQQIVAQNVLLDQAHKNGVMVIERFERSILGGKEYRVQRDLRYGHERETTDAFNRWFALVDDLAPAIADHPAHLAINGFDEPADIYVGPMPFSELSQAIAERLRQADGYHPYFVNFGWPVASEPRWTDHQDAFAYYDYSMKSDKGARVTSYRTRFCEEIAAANHKPMFSMAASCEHNKINVAQQLAGSYIMLVNGTRGLFYFTWTDKHEESAKALTELAAHIKVLAPALTTRRPRQEIITRDLKPADTSVDAALLAMPDKKVIFMLVNKTQSPVEMRYRFEWMEQDGALQGVIDKKSVPVKNREAVEKLEPLATRAYLMEGYTLPDMYTMHRVTMTETKE